MDIGYGPAVIRGRLCRCGRSLQTAEPNHKGPPYKITNKGAVHQLFIERHPSSETRLDSCRLVSPIVSIVVLLTKQDWSSDF